MKEYICKQNATGSAEYELEELRLCTGLQVLITARSSTKILVKNESICLSCQH